MELRSSRIGHLKDEELVSLYIASQRNEYFEEIYERYANKVYRKCYSFVLSRERAEDFTHDIFLKLMMKIGTYKETSKFSTWLYSITYNFCMDQIRTSKKKSETFMGDEYDVEDDTEEAESMDFQSTSLKTSMSQMPSDERALLQMKYQEDFSIKEIAETLEISESAVKMRLLRSKDKLKKIYMEHISLAVLILVKIIAFIGIK